MRCRSCIAANCFSAAVTFLLLVTPVQGQVSRADVLENDANWVSVTDHSEDSQTAVVKQVGYHQPADAGVLPFLKDFGRSTSSSCATPWWAHRTSVFGEYLSLRPTDSDIAYAVEQNDATANAFPTGPVGITAIDASSGFRAGVSFASSECSSLVVTYTGWEGDDSDVLRRNGNNIINSRILHPSTATTGANSLQSSAESAMEFSLLDFGYRQQLLCTKSTVFNWFGGFRYGEIEQSLDTQQQISVATGLASTDTDVDFDGFGLLMGLDAERRSCKTGLLCYSRGAGSLLGGDWTGRYRQTNQFGGGVIGNDFHEFRITPVVEAELGVGYQNDSGNLRATVGYTASSWFNALKTRSYVEGVRSGNFDYEDESIGFIGLTTRVELRF
ncbi:MAG: Lpg1974 family pore-forming outer membrane protein [Rubripirellula sp.]